jgi:hypothetical protein
MIVSWQACLEDSREIRNPQPATRNRALVASTAFFGVVLLGLSLSSLAISDDQSKASSDIIQALQERFGMTSDEVESALLKQSEAIAVHQTLKQELDEDYSGAWFDDEKEMLVLALTEPDLRPLVSSAGPIPVTVDYSLRDFHNLSRQLLESFRESHLAASIAGWYVDVEGNQLAVQVLGNREQQLRQVEGYLDSAGVDTAPIRLESTEGRARFLNRIRGGDVADNPERGRICSVGFSVEGGFTIAGHCGWHNT